MCVFVLAGEALATLASGGVERHKAARLVSMSVPAKAKSKAWWLQHGTETCEQCGQPFSHGAGVRCAHCDALLCCVCAERDEEHETRCSECCESGEEA